MSTLLSVLLACAGAPPEPEPADQAEAAGVAGVACPEGTRLRESSNGSGSEVYCDRDGVMLGPYLRKYPSGERAAKGAYVNSEPDGDWTWWHESGQESQKGKYTKGKQVGSWTRWHEDGTRAEEGDYLSGRKAGTWTTYYPSGRKKDAGIFHNDMKNGVWTYWFDDEENTIEKTELWEGGAMKKEEIINKEPPDPSKAKAKGKKGG